ncbi:MAG: acyltransferase [Bacteroidota bacterium]
MNQPHPPVSADVPAYYPALDGLRAIAVFLVMLEHLNPPEWLNPRPWLFPGKMGVQLFFVLSGYLIGGILMRQNLRLRAAGQSPFSKAKSFWTRRALRIVPAYYFLIAIVVFLKVPQHILSLLPWLFTYTYNVSAFLTQGFNYPVNHFWSLACEEQFYILLPLCLLPAKPSWFPWIIGIMGLTGMLSVFLFIYTGYNIIYASMLLPATFQFFAAGIFVAWLQLTDRKFPLFAWLPLLIPVYVLLSQRPFLYPGKNLLNEVLPVFPILCAGLIHWVTKGNAPKVLTGFLTSAPLVRFGLYSYGLYLFHNVVPQVYFLISLRTGFSIEADSMFYVFFFLSLLIAALSYHFLELPFLRLSICPDLIALSPILSKTFWECSK